MVGVDAFPEHHLRELRDLRRGAEEAGVRRDAVHRPGVLVVDHALENAAARGNFLGRGQVRKKAR